MTTQPGAYLPNPDGDFVFEVEDAGTNPGNGWVFKDSPGGHEGDTGSGHYVWEGGDNFGTPGNGVLSYEITPTQSGRYLVNLRGSREQTPDGSEENDTWVRITENGNALNAIGSRGYGPDVRGDGWLKTYQSGGGADEWIWANKNVDHVGIAVAYDLEAGKTYTFQMSGRSEGHEVDRVHIAQANGSEGPFNDLNEFATLSERAEGEVVVTNAPVPSTPAPSAPAPVSGGGQNAEGYGPDVKLYLIDANTDQRIAEITEGSTLDMSGLQDGSLSIEADVAGGGVASATLDLNGSGGPTQTESVEPYALFGDAGGDFAGGTLGTGSHTLTVSLYDGENGGGSMVGERTFNFATGQSTSAPVPQQVSEPAPSAPAPIAPSSSPSPDLPGIADEFDYIVMQFDGDVYDRDDIAALPVAATLLNAAGLADKTVFMYNNNLNVPGNGSQINDMRAAADYAESLGITTVDYEANEAGATQQLTSIINSGRKVLMIEAGPMEAAYRALDAADGSNIDNITFISHSTWNEDFNERGSRTWSDLKRDFSQAEFIDIEDQNWLFRSNDWNGIEDRFDDPVFDAMRDVMFRAGNNMESGSPKYNDASDAGMVSFALTGDMRRDVGDVEDFFRQNDPDFA